MLSYIGSKTVLILVTRLVAILCIYLFSFTDVKSIVDRFSYNITENKDKFKIKIIRKYFQYILLLYNL